MNHNIDLYFHVTLRKKDIHIDIEYYHKHDIAYINMNNYNENDDKICLNDGLRSLNFSNDEIKKINHFLKYKTVDLSKTSIQPSDSDYKHENLKFFTELLYNNQRNITVITDIIFEVVNTSTHNNFKINLRMDTDYSCVTSHNVNVEVKESIEIKDPDNNKILHTRHFNDVNPKHMDIDSENKLFEKIFEGTNAETIMYPINHKTANYYLDQANLEPKNMYLASINNETLKKLKKIKKKVLNKKPLNMAERNLKHTMTYFYTKYPEKVNPDIYDVVKAYPILKPKPIPKYITKGIALSILNQIVNNIVSNKL